MGLVEWLRTPHRLIYRTETWRASVMYNPSHLFLGARLQNGHCTDVQYEDRGAVLYALAVTVGVFSRANERAWRERVKVVAEQELKR